MGKKCVYCYQNIFCEYRGDENLPYVKTLVKCVYHNKFSEDKVISEKLMVGYHTLFTVQGNGRFRNHSIKEENLLKLLTTKKSLDIMTVLFKKEGCLGSPYYDKVQVIFNTNSLVNIFNKGDKYDDYKTKEY